MDSVLIVIDVMNDIVHKDGKVSSKGYYNFIEKYDSIRDINAAIDKAKENNVEIIYVKTAFSSDYNDLPRNSVLFGKADQSSAFIADTWGTELYEDMLFIKKSKIIVKNRISPFFNTDLEKYLRNKRIKEIYMCGVATDIAIESTARDAHDKDFGVYVIGNCCVAGSLDDHRNALKNISKFAHVIELKDFF